VAAEMLATNRAQLAYAHCQACHAEMEPFATNEVAQEGIEKWSWFSLWSVACELHTKWIRAAYDPQYVIRCQRRVQALEQEQLDLRRAIGLWDVTATQAMRLVQEEITHEQYEANLEAIRSKFAPGLFETDPEALPVRLERLEAALLQWEQDLHHALWVPPVTWKL
jgi:hypothetical protein